jgi:hypothetical protein
VAAAGEAHPAGAEPRRGGVRLPPAQGLNKAQAAGIVGNLQQESSVDPAAEQSGVPGRGIAQWSVGGRWDTSPGDNLLWYARSQHASPHALNTQLNFVWYELKHFPGYGLQQLRAAKTVAAATKAFEAHYEVCGECNESRRIAMAQVTLRDYGGLTSRRRASVRSIRHRRTRTAARQNLAAVSRAATSLSARSGDCRARRHAGTGDPSSRRRHAA